MLFLRCPIIDESMSKCSVFSKYKKEFKLAGSTAEFGTKPTMPKPSIQPASFVYGREAIADVVKDLPLTWACAESGSRYGVYYTVIALFGTKHWVTILRNGESTLRIYDEEFV